ncbi:30529_t:CDS:2 [Gigaspora margarita]|uniref:30529_t:CDS:1 n=1 Tax=Gigaspora margarita TaxID=4874 RepID=A0ABN7UE91_GIGMA|nr:30529_t:CDS:2 [Gigaspora margarita]
MLMAKDSRENLSNVYQLNYLLNLVNDRWRKKIVEIIEKCKEQVEDMEKRFTRNNVANVVSPCDKGFVIAGAWFPFALIPGAILLGDVIEESKACEIFEKVVIIKKKSKS